jgi:hypothetical protein
MPHTFDRELKHLLEGSGCHKVRSGKHEIWFSPLSQRHFPVPTRIVSRHTANGILKDAGLPKKF